MWKNQPFAARLGFALHGLRSALRTEPSLRFQVAALAAALAVLVWLRPEPIWWALTLLASGLVLGAELLNTAIEELADELNPGAHPRIRLIKDCAAAAVLMASAAALGVAVAFLVHVLHR